MRRIDTVDGEGYQDVTSHARWFLRGQGYGEQSKGGRQHDAYAPTFVTSLSSCPEVRIHRPPIYLLPLAPTSAGLMLHFGDGFCSYRREVDLLVDVFVDLAYQRLHEEDGSAWP